MKANQGVILLMLAALILWLVWSNASPFKANAASVATGTSTTTAKPGVGLTGGGTNLPDVNAACANVDARTRSNVSEFFSSRAAAFISPADIAAAAIQKFPGISKECLQAIAYNIIK